MKTPGWFRNAYRCHAGTWTLVVLAGLLLVLHPHTVLGGARPQGGATNAAQQSQDKTAGMVGHPAGVAEIATCKGCHEDFTGPFERSPHWKTMNDTRGGGAKQACEACHGPGQAHVDDPS